MGAAFRSRFFPQRILTVAISWFSVAATVTLGPARAWALDPEVNAETAAQFYEVRSPSGQTVLTRRRVLTTLGVSAYELTDSSAGASHKGPLLFFRTRARYDSDYGASSAEADPKSLATYVPGFERGPVDLMYAYVEGQRLLGGALGFKLGRQYLVDSLGWWSLDGLSVRVLSPFYVALEAYGGFETRGGLPLSTPRFERDGIWRGNREYLDSRAYLPLVESTMAPAYGATASSIGLAHVHVEAGYRRVENLGTTNADIFGTRAAPTLSGARVSQERIGVTGNVSIGEVVGIKGGTSYDILNARVATAYASIDAYLSRKLTLSADWDFVQPSFDGDSIWNAFFAMPSHTVQVGTRIEASRRVSLSFGSVARVFGRLKPGDPINPVATALGETDASVNGGGHAAVRVKASESTFGFRADGTTGSEGYRYGGDAYVDTKFERRFLLSARASAWAWNDTARPGRDATSVGYVAGLGYVTGARSDIRMEFEHNANRLVGQRYRLLFWFNVGITK